MWIWRRRGCLLDARIFQTKSSEPIRGCYTCFLKLMQIQGNFGFLDVHVDAKRKLAYLRGPELHQMKKIGAERRLLEERLDLREFRKGRWEILVKIHSLH